MGIFNEQGCGQRKSTSLFIRLYSVWKIRVNKKFRVGTCATTNPQGQLWSWVQCSLWQNWAFGVCVSFRSVLEDVSRLDRLHAPKLIPDILLMLWISTLIHWSSPSEFQLSGPVSVDSIFFSSALKTTEQVLCKKLLKSSILKSYIISFKLTTDVRWFSAKLELYAYLCF